MWDSENIELGTDTAAGETGETTSAATGAEHLARVMHWSMRENTQSSVCVKYLLRYNDNL